MLELQNYMMLLHEVPVYFHHMLKYWEILLGGIIKIAKFSEDTQLITSDKSKEHDGEHSVHNGLCCLTLT